MILANLEAAIICRLIAGMEYLTRVGLPLGWVGISPWGLGASEGGYGDDGTPG